MQHRPQDVIASIKQTLTTYFLLRWTLANVTGWMLGIVAGAFLADVLAGLHIIAVFAGGAVTGLIVGGMQWLALRASPQEDNIRPVWVGISVLAALCAVIPTMLVTPAIVFGVTVGFGVMGSVFGACFGLVQSLGWERSLEAGAFWALVNGLAGCLCSTTMVGLSSPVLCVLGPVVFGLVTGVAWLRRSEI
jgi:hypothetical protein